MIGDLCHLYFNEMNCDDLLFFFLIYLCILYTLYISYERILSKIRFYQLQKALTKTRIIQKNLKY